LLGFVRSKMQLWTLFTQATEFRTRPSELVGIDPRDDPFTAFCFDEAVFMWGRFVDGEMKRAVKGAKSDRQAQQKADMRWRTIMQEEEEVRENDEHQRQLGSVILQRF
jgi:hypothetical protein